MRSHELVVLYSSRWRNICPSLLVDDEVDRRRSPNVERPVVRVYNLWVGNTLTSKARCLLANRHLRVVKGAVVEVVLMKLLLVGLGMLTSRD